MPINAAKHRRKNSASVRPQVKELMNFDLPKPPNGYKTDLALVVAPYFDLWFAKRVTERLKPKRLRFLVDDGARAEAVDDLRIQCPGIEIGLGCAAGVVHLKAYYLEFIKSNGTTRQLSRQFLFGSANATEAAFSGETNAELLAKVELSPNGDKQLIAHFKNIVNAIESVNAMENGNREISALASGASEHVPGIFLPRFEVKKPGSPPGFDAWLKRGKLAAKYRDPQQFLKVAVELKKPPPPGRVAKILQNRRLAVLGRSNIVRYAYIGTEETDNSLTADVEKDTKGATPQWISKYCVWTHLGYWLSEECYKSKGPKGENILVSKSSPKRQSWIEELEENGENRKWSDLQKGQFLGILQNTWNDLQSDGADPNEYLKGRNGQIDKSE